MAIWRKPSSPKPVHYLQIVEILRAPKDDAAFTPEQRRQALERWKAHRSAIQGEIQSDIWKGRIVMGLGLAAVIIGVVTAALIEEAARFPAEITSTILSSPVVEEFVLLLGGSELLNMGLDTLVYARHAQGFFEALDALQPETELDTASSATSS